MIKKYIRGHSTRGDEVIKELEKLGGVNKYGFVCVFPSEFYIIDHTDNNCIKGVSRGYVKELIEQTFEEIKLPSRPRDVEDQRGKGGRQCPPLVEELGHEPECGPSEPLR